MADDQNQDPRNVMTALARRREGGKREEDRAVLAEEVETGETPMDSGSSMLVARTSRKVRRSREERPRAKTIAPRRLSREELRQAENLSDLDDAARPRSREECKMMSRPCPHVGCRHHLYLDVNMETGSIKVNFPHLEVWELKETCSLDVADRGGVTLEEVGEIMNLTRERIRQVEVRGLIKLKMAGGDSLG